MQPNGLAPMLLVIGFGDDGEDGGDIRPQGNPGEKADAVKGDVSLRPLEKQNGSGNTDEATDDRFFMSPHRGKAPYEKQGNAITKGKGGIEPPCLPVGEGMAVFNQREQGSEDGSGGKVDEPETPEDEERPEFHGCPMFGRGKGDRG